MESCTLRSAGDLLLFFALCGNIKRKKSPISNLNLSGNKITLKKNTQTGSKENFVHLVLRRALRLYLVFLEFFRPQLVSLSLLSQYLPIGKVDPHVMISGIPERSSCSPKSPLIDFRIFAVTLEIFTPLSKVAKARATL